MRYTVFLQPVHQPGFEGLYYAYLPTLDLTTHGHGVEGALAAGHDLADLWITERTKHREPVTREGRAFIAEVELADALLSA